MLAAGTTGNLINILFDVLDGNPFLTDSQGRTCLHHAAANGSPKVVSKLLDWGLDPNMPDLDGWTPLFWTAKAGRLENYRLLEDAGSNPKTECKTDGPHILSQFSMANIT